ncbi:recombinase family protein [Thermoactinomyces daqus]|uniref:Recombinase family protein n=1 Tax=Thermoactinomyces daqus TaxID=1329516 RepID=A0A7W1XA50_9BACL|nr:recombinase family protein [Thermoactinomyces daqus]MBA4542943.1 recombinase family protein [Thermoactinomyces daqus]
METRSLDEKEPICAVYARVSVERNSESVEHQVSLLREFVRSKGLGVIPDEFIYEDVVSASKYSIWERPAMKRLLEDAKDGKFSILLFKGISRSVRDTQEALEILERFKQKGIRVISFEENYDSSREDSKFIFGIHALLAEQESEKISVRVKLGMKEKVKKGEWAGLSPFGYRVKDKKLVVDPEEAEIVKKIFDMYVDENVGTSTIAVHLNEHGYRTRNGRPWSRKTVRDMLKNEVYIGRITYNKKSLKRIRDFDSETQKKKWVRIPNSQDDWVIVENSHDAIIDKKKFEKAQIMLAERSRNLEPSNVIFPLAGILKCKKCKKSIVGLTSKAKGKTYRYYCCNTYLRFGRSFCSQPNINAEKIEAYILELLAEKLKTIQDQIVLGKNIGVVKPNTKDIEKKLKQVEAQIEKVNRDTSELYFERDNMEPLQYQFIMQQLREKAKSLNEEKEQLLSKLQISEESEEMMKEVESHLTEFFNLDISEPRKVRKVLRHFIEVIWLDDKHLDIHYKFDF